MKLCLLKTSAVVGIVGTVLGASAYTVRGDESGKANPGKPKKTELRAALVQMPLDLSGKTPVVEVKINGAGPFKFAIDTGAAHSALDDDVAKKLALESTETIDMPDTPGGEPQAVPVVRLSSLTLGQAAFFDVQAVVEPTGQLGADARHRPEQRLRVGLTAQTLESSGGLLFTNKEMLKKQVIKLATDEALRWDLGYKLYRYLMEVVSWEVVAAQYYSAYHAAIEEKESGTPAYFDQEF